MNQTSGHYDYDTAALRLSTAARSDTLDEAVKTEVIFLRKESLTVTVPPTTVSFNGQSVDVIASRLLGKNWKQSVPLSVTGDGNCLFNALSVAIFGHEFAATELKVKTCIEMVLNESFT